VEAYPVRGFSYDVHPSYSSEMPELGEQLADAVLKACRGMPSVVQIDPPRRNIIAVSVKTAVCHISMYLHMGVDPYRHASSLVMVCEAWARRPGNPVPYARILSTHPMQLQEQIAFLMMLERSN